VIARFPTGLVLYWMTTNLWTVGQGLITRRLIPKTALPAPGMPKRSSRTPPKEAAPPPTEDGDAPAPKTAPAQQAQPRRVKRKKKARR
jgi:YidC/Oxa1 family membrane protein insertase